jgi:cation-transporting P-type ATPase I
MLTGDHPQTATAVASELGFANGAVVTGGELDAMDDDKLVETLHGNVVFARVSPEHKVRIVEALRRTGKAVAVTGDGANDAAAIRIADVGVALGLGSTPAAREAADLIVTSDQIETLIDAIVEGRAMWSSVREALAVLLGGNLGEIGFTVGAGLLRGESPLNARQLLLVNLLTDVLPSMAIATRPPLHVRPEALVHEGPDASLASPLTRAISERALITAGATFGAWSIGSLTGTRQRASTIALLSLVGAQLGQTALIGWRSPLVVAASAASAGLLVGIVETPGVSGLFGCRPVGPFGLLTAGGAATAATGVAALVNAVHRPARATVPAA